MPRVALALALLAVGCAPTLTPPYRDYVAAGDATPDVLAAALEEAGWSVIESRTDHVVSTESKRVRTGFTSHTVAALDLIPLDGPHLRIQIRGTNRSIFGGQTKVYALDPDLRQSILGPVTDALAKRGLRALDAPRERDEDATED